jgi:hypothetical protein
MKGKRHSPVAVELGAVDHQKKRGARHPMAAEQAAVPLQGNPGYPVIFLASASHVAMAFLK